MTSDADGEAKLKDDAEAEPNPKIDSDARAGNRAEAKD